MKVNPMFDGPVSVGTVSLVKLIQDRCSLGLAEAKQYVDSAIFDGKEVTIPIPDETKPEDLSRAIRSLDTPATITFEVIH